MAGAKNGGSKSLDKYAVVMSPRAMRVLGPDETALKARLNALIAGAAEEMPSEVLLWQGEPQAKVTAFINRHVKTVYIEYFDVNDDARRRGAIRVVSLGIGARPDLPSGAEYVRQIRGIWKGLLPSERRDS